MELEIARGKAGEAVFACDDVQWLNLAGEPRIPWKVMTVLLPPDADSASVAATMSDIQYEAVAGTWKVSPALPFVTFREGQQIAMWPEGKTIVDGRDEGIYDVNAFWPEARARVLSAGKLRTYQLAQVAVPLVRYNPVSGELLKLSQTNVAVTFDRELSAEGVSKSTGQRDKVGEARVRGLAVNYTQWDSAYEAVSGTMSSVSAQSDGNEPNTGYVIITTSAIEANSTKLGDFVTHKQSLGFDVQVITEADFGGGVGDVAVENIRSWLQSNYLSDNIEYVLLIGNPDPCTGDIPMKILWPLRAGVYYAVSDYYYVDLTCDWDRDGDGLYAEFVDDFGIGIVDRYWEVIVGRIPYYGSISDLDAILQKSIEYENETISGSTQWRKKALLPMGDDPNTRYYLGEAIKSEILEPAGWSSHRIYKEDYGLVPPPETVPTTYDNVTAVWNGQADNSDGNFGLVVWWSHGNTQLAQDIMDVGHVPYLNDTHPSFVFQAPCRNAWPASNTLSYQLLKNGAICTIGATRDSYPEFEVEFAGTATNAGMAYEYSARLVLGWTCGEALHDLRQTVYPMGGSEWMNYLVFNIYGDPSLRLIDEKSNGVHYVDKDALGGANNGSSWENAFTDLNSALAASRPGDEIRVAEGVYLPEEERSDSFRLVADVDVYGGYAGFGEADPNQRDIEENLTVLSGDIGSPNDPGDNCYHVVIGALDAILDGFTITAGNANGEFESPNGNGGGMYCVTGMEISNCTFRDNSGYGFGGGLYASQDVKIDNCAFIDNTAMYGGGVYDRYGDITVTNCIFRNNYANSQGGGGIRIVYATTAIVSNCTFEYNRAYWTGGAIGVDDSIVTVSNCRFNANSADYGGAIFCRNDWTTVSDCTFTGNFTTGWSSRGGGAMYCRFSNATVTNCTYTNNLSAADGGAISNYSSEPNLINCILWGNTALSDGDEISLAYGSSIDVNYCNVQGGQAGIYDDGSGNTINWGSGNVDVDPLFVDADGVDNTPGTEDDNLRLSSDSLCIDAGDNNLVPSDVADIDGDGNTVETIPWDLEGHYRMRDGDCDGNSTVDMGAYEYGLFGDLDCSLDIDFTDFAILALAWASEPGDLNWNRQCDLGLPLDEYIDWRDLNVLCENWLVGK